MEKSNNKLKKLLFGYEAIALGAVRAGVSVFAGYPGCSSVNILEAITGGSGAPAGGAAFVVEWAVNEKAALDAAAGVALSGGRALAAMDQAGFCRVSDPLLSLNCLGVSGALVVVVTDDAGPFSSHAEQDTRSLGAYLKLAVFDPSSPEEAYTMVCDALDYSEKYRRPVILRPTAMVCHSYASIDLETFPVRAAKTPLSRHLSARHGPSFTPLKAAGNESIEADLAKMREDFSSYRGNSLFISPDASGPLSKSSLPGGSGLLGIAAGGVSYAYVMEILNPMPTGLKILKIGSLPFPQDLGLRFLEGLNEVLVIEELDPVIEDELLRICGIRHLRAEIRGKRSGDMPRSGAYTPALAAEKIEAFLQKVWLYISDLGKEKLPDSAAAAPVFTSLASVSPDILAAAANAADAQIKPLPEPPPIPLRSPALCTDCPHRGSFHAVKEAVRKHAKGLALYSGTVDCAILGNTRSLDLIEPCLDMGMNRAEGELRIVFMGEAGFFQTGIQELINAVCNQTDLIVVVLENMAGKAKKINIPALAESLGVKEIVRANPFDPDAAGEAAAQLIDKPGVRLLIFEGSCSHRAISGGALL